MKEKGFLEPKDLTVLPMSSRLWAFGAAHLASTWKDWEHFPAPAYLIPGGRPGTPEGEPLIRLTSRSEGCSTKR